MKTLPLITQNYPAYPSESHEAHEDIQYQGKLDIIHINSSKDISKDGDYMKVDGKSFKISKLTLLDLVKKLNALGVDCELLGQDNVKYIPAVFLANFSSIYCNFIRPTTNPFQLRRVEKLSYAAIHTVSPPNITDIIVFNRDVVTEHTIVSNQVFYKNIADNSDITINFKVKYVNYNIILMDSMFNPTSPDSVYLFRSLSGGLIS